MWPPALGAPSRQTTGRGLPTRRHRGGKRVRSQRRRMPSGKSTDADGNVSASIFRRCGKVRFEPTSAVARPITANTTLAPHTAPFSCGALFFRLGRDVGKMACAHGRSRSAAGRVLYALPAASARGLMRRHVLRVEFLPHALGNDVGRDAVLALRLSGSFVPGTLVPSLSRDWARVRDWSPASCTSNGSF